MLSSRGTVLSCLVLLALLHPAHACTTLVAAKGATSDGSVMAAHSNDGDGDVAGNLAIVASGDHLRHCI